MRDCADQVSSGPPQLMLMTVGVGLAWAASLIASTKAWSVLGPKYTTCAAPGATDPATSMSSSTSPSAPEGSAGALDPPSTLTAVTVGTDRPRPEKYVCRSLGANPPPNSRIAIVCPVPSVPAGNW